MDWQVGQKVIVVSRHGRVADREGTITKIARKYLTVETRTPAPYGSKEYIEELQYEIATGHEKHDAYDSRSRITTSELQAEKKKRMELELRLKEHGIMRSTYSSWMKITTAKLEAIVEILDAD